MNKNLSNQYDWMTRLNSSYGIGAVLMLGIQDGINICAISITILYMLFLIYFVRTIKRLFLCGFVCQMMQVVTCVFLVHGEFDVFLSQEYVFNFIRIFYIILSIVFFIIGIVLFRDWYVHRFKIQNKSQWVNLPRFPDKMKVEHKDLFVECFKTLFYVVVSIVFGAGIVVLSAFAIQDYAVFIMLIDAISKDQLEKGEQAIIQYAVSFTVPFIIAWAMALLYCAIPKIRKATNEAVPMVKIIFSSIFISLAIGFVIVMFLK